MNKSNEIALQLVNNFSQDINVKLFPFQGVNNFFYNENKALLYNLSQVAFFGFEEGIFLQYRSKNSNSSFLTIEVPYTEADNGGFFIVDLELFCPFFETWFNATGLGICSVANPDLIIISSEYEFGGLDFITNSIP